MAKYKKVDNCGPVAYPDQSGRYLGEGEVVEDDAANNWAPLMALGFIVETGGSVTQDKQESPAEMAVAVEIPAKVAEIEIPAEPELVMETAPDLEPASKSKSKRSKKNKKEEVEDGMRTANDGGGGEGLDSSSSGESDS